MSRYIHEIRETMAVHSFVAWERLDRAPYSASMSVVNATFESHIWRQQHPLSMFLCRNPTFPRYALRHRHPSCPDSGKLLMPRGTKPPSSTGSPRRAVIRPMLPPPRLFTYQPVDQLLRRPRRILARGSRTSKQITFLTLQFQRCHWSWTPKRRQPRTHRLLSRTWRLCPCRRDDLSLVGEQLLLSITEHPLVCSW